MKILGIKIRKYWKNKINSSLLLQRNIDSFIRRTKKLDNGCWTFNGSEVNGYRRITFNKKIILTHRFSYMIFNGKIPKDKIVCHSCDNRYCCYPKHLWLGTYKDNTQDMINKGRQADPELISKNYKERGINRGDKNGMRLHPERRAFGSKSGTSKLNEEIVIKIRKMYDSGRYTQKELSRIFGVFRGNIQKIITRKTWKHI